MSFVLTTLRRLANLTLIGALLLITAAVFLPTKGVKTFNNLEQYALKHIKKSKILNPEEELIAFYDMSFFMNAKDSVLITSDRVIHHNKKGNFSLNLNDIDELYYLSKKNHEHRTFVIRDKQGKFLSLPIYHDHELFARFLNEAMGNRFG